MSICAQTKRNSPKNSYMRTDDLFHRKNITYKHEGISELYENSTSDLPNGHSQLRFFQSFVFFSFFNFSGFSSSCLGGAAIGKEIVNKLLMNDHDLVCN